MVHGYRGYGARLAARGVRLGFWLGLGLGLVHLGAMHRRVARHDSEAARLEGGQVRRHVHLAQLRLAALHVALVEHMRRRACWSGRGVGALLSGNGRAGKGRAGRVRAGRVERVSGGAPVHAKSAVPEPITVPPSATQCLTHAAMGTPAPCSPRTWCGCG